MTTQKKHILMRGGVLVIGSLAWDKSRGAWRKANLIVDDRVVNVPAPIRYGRLSAKRQTFTMVFSQDGNVPEKLGRAIFYPFISNPVGLDEIDRQSCELMKAERTLTQLPEGYCYTWGFGALALLLNPKTIISKPDESRELKEFWQKKSRRAIG